MWQLGDCRGPAYSQSSALLFIIVIIIIITSVYKLVFLSFVSPGPALSLPSCFIPFCLHDAFKNQQSREASPSSLPHSDPWLPTWSSFCGDGLRMFESASRHKHPGSVYPPDIANYAQGQKTKLTLHQCVLGPGGWSSTSFLIIDPKVMHPNSNGE